MRILGNDIVEIPIDFTSRYGVEMAPLEDLFARADFISINCDLNPTSRHLINSRTLASVRPAAVIINTARGPIIDEAALAEALQRGQLAGAALDVFELEPLPADSPLRAMDNVLLAPHNSNASPTAWEHVHWNTIRNLLEGLRIDAEGLDTVRREMRGN
jgi:D-3-phosphoglycerate dehydrogenase